MKYCSETELIHMVLMMNLKVIMLKEARQTNKRDHTIQFHSHKNLENAKLPIVTENRLVVTWGYKEDVKRHKETLVLVGDGCLSS